jgi:molybdenum cofactor cytidylyltransferase
MTPSDNVTLTGILLAAGRGRRFDPAGGRNKLLQRLPDGDPVVVASARKLLSCCSRVVAVVPPEDGGVADALRALGCEVTVCADADSGMGLSLAHAVRYATLAQPMNNGWLVALGDMPFVDASTLRALACAIGEGAGIAAPTFDGQRGNPVAFGARHSAALLALDGDQGARRLLTVAVPDPGILRDIDTPDDLPA